jgi:hypothetical protein
MLWAYLAGTVIYSACHMIGIEAEGLAEVVLTY